MLPRRTKAGRAGVTAMPCTTSGKRINGSWFAGGFLAQRSSAGWIVYLSDETSPRLWGQYLVPFSALPSRYLRWLGHRMLSAMRQSVVGQEGSQRIPGAEALKLTRWLVRWAPRPKGARRRAEPRWTSAMSTRLARSRQGGGYEAERSRRGWVVKFHSYSGRLRGHYIVPFRALRSHGRRWYGGPIINAMQQSLMDLEGTRRISESEAKRLLNGTHEQLQLFRVGGTAVRKN